MTDNQDKTGVETTQGEGTYVQDEGLMTEEWQDELPPEDDFHDQVEPLEEMMDEATAEELQLTAIEQNNRGKKVLFIAMGVGVLFIGGLAYLQFSSGTSSLPGGMIPASNVMDVRDLRNIQITAAHNDKDTVLPQTVTPKAASTNLEQLYNNVHPTVPRPVKAEEIPDGAIADSVAPKKFENTSTSILTTTAAERPVEIKAPIKKEIPVPPPAASTAMPDKKVEPQIAKIEDVPVNMQKMPAPPQALEDGAKIKSLMGQIESLQESLDETVKKNEELLAKVALLEKKAKAPVEKNIKSVLAKEGPKKVAVKAEEKEPRQAVTKPEKRKVAVKKKRAPTKTASQPTPVAPKATDWVLRSATPDAVWVSKGPDSYELRRLAVGDTLPSLGMVKEIRNIGNKWQLVTDKVVLR